MLDIKKIALYSAAFFTMAHGGLAHADGFTSHQSVSEKSYEHYADKLPAEKKLELREYLDYVASDREPCQGYRQAPVGFVKDGCDLKRIAPQKVAAVPSKVENLKMSKILTDYEINFAFDSAAIEPAAGLTIDQIASEIKDYKPNEVTVTGHTDTSGPTTYNAQLSKQRANSVSKALLERGVTNRIIDQEARGEYDLAVQTNDGVALRENRRVVVEFRK
jgi:outer membrane protein OmpA-like peptidoglycan-associated protein|tara:strand:+ start:36075 stop:36731 length:657 start_codon:yes stop_codon:yes gene_type:complete